MAHINKESLDFLIKLGNNNDRDWFATHKAEYEKNKLVLDDFAEDLLQKVAIHDNIETATGKKALHRIYRDVRFSKNKAPYKTNWSGSLKRATKQLRGGYYFHIEPGNSFIGGGFWGPSSPDLKLIRENILDFGDELKSIISNKTFVDYFGELKGEQLKTAPKGFDKEHKHIELLRYKQFIVMRPFTDKEVLAADFTEKVSEGFKNMRPLFDYMSEALTTNANGESIV